MSILFKAESYTLVEACFEFYNEKGCGFLEPVYQECLEIEFEHLKLPAVPQPSLALSYRGRPLKQKSRPDFVCYGKILLDLRQCPNSRTNTERSF